MKIQIVSETGGHTGARLLIEGALLRLPDHIKDIPPDILMKIMPLEGLPRATRCRWGLGGLRAGTKSENWAICSTAGPSGPHTVSVFLLEETGGKEDYYFQRDIVSAILECAFTRTPVVDMVKAMMREYPRRSKKHQARSLFTREYARFLMNPDAFEAQEPDLMPIFKRLREEIPKLTELAHTP